MAVHEFSVLIFLQFRLKKQYFYDILSFQMIIKLFQGMELL